MLMEALSAHHDRLRAFELDRARKMLAAGEPAQVAMEALSRRLTSKLLHEPLSVLSAAGSERARLAVALMRFALRRVRSRFRPPPMSLASWRFSEVCAV